MLGFVMFLLSLAHLSRSNSVGIAVIVGDSVVGAGVSFGELVGVTLEGLYEGLAVGAAVELVSSAGLAPNKANITDPSGVVSAVASSVASLVTVLVGDVVGIALQSALPRLGTVVITSFSPAVFSWLYCSSSPSTCALSGASVSPSSAITSTFSPSAFVVPLLQGRSGPKQYWPAAQLTVSIPTKEQGASQFMMASS